MSNNTFELKTDPWPGGMSRLQKFQFQVRQFARYADALGQHAVPECEISMPLDQALAMEREIAVLQQQSDNWIKVMHALNKINQDWPIPGTDPDWNLGDAAAAEITRLSTLHPIPLPGLEDRIVSNWEMSTLSYLGFTIQVKRDFGNQPYRINGMPCMWGYIVVDRNGANATPGAGWFRTVEDAQIAIDIFVKAGPGMSSDTFYQAYTVATKAAVAAKRSIALELVDAHS